MNKQELIKEYKKPEDKLLLSQILDKIEMAEGKDRIETSDFLDMYQVALVKTFLRKIKIERYKLEGGFDDAERKIAIFYSEKDKEEMIAKNIESKLKAIRITLPQAEKGKYTHRNYLGGIVKLGMKREKVGDILVAEEGADILVKAETAESLKQELETLTRFQSATMEIIEISKVRKPEIKVEEVSIIVPSMRLDNIVSDLAKTSRSKAVQIINQERVFVNGQNETKVSKAIKMGDIITIRGKGRFIIKETTGTTRSGRSVLRIEKYV